jgi:hypothetical protein
MRPLIQKPIAAESQTNEHPTDDPLSARPRNRFPRAVEFLRSHISVAERADLYGTLIREAFSHLAS